MYSTSSMVRTMELLLGLPPLSQYDAAARPMSASFAATADPAPFTHRPARISLEARNRPGAVGQRESQRMDFSREDAAPEGSKLQVGDWVVAIGNALGLEGVRP